MAVGWVWVVLKILSNSGHSGISRVRAEKLRIKFTYGKKIINLSLGVALGKYFLIASSASFFSPSCILLTFPELDISLKLCWNNQRLGASWDRIYFLHSNLLSKYLLSEIYSLHIAAITNSYSFSQ